MTDNKKTLEQWEKVHKDGYLTFVFWWALVSGGAGAVLFTPAFLYFAPVQILESVFCFSFLFPVGGIIFATIFWLERETAYSALKEKVQTEDRLKALEAELAEVRKDTRFKSDTPSSDQKEHGRTSEAIRE